MRNRPRWTRRAAVAVTALAAVAALPATAVTAATHGSAPRAAHPAPDEWPTYVVTVRRGMDPAMVADHHGIRPVHVFHTAMNGFAAPLSPDQVTALRANPLVESIEEDGVGSSFGTPA
ncbi:hypothetical protein GCM10010347_57680 [Streptomyces cirratus]|uniref:Inhibitor I9 domain-containing protein n=1 Tax=Streptomyces cirratus TaxID=68187 RepID=A0ABQ3F4W4_9ACTN|nr:protease inhibitor I9 family protein [Streptomyces cirratus]GHB79652.1 hypothetical protein GCM10010347_57680 [Streptomyces cirratus]